MKKIICEICKREPATILIRLNDVCSNCYRELWKIVDGNKKKISWRESIEIAFKKLEKEKERKKNCSV